MKDYRNSHNKPGYSQIYNKTYEHGYYAAQWKYIEKPILENILINIKSKGKTKYLDFACGTGRILSLGMSIFGNATGIDISEEMAKYAEKNVPGAKIIYPYDITKEPLNEMYEVITAFRFFLNAQPELRKKVLCALSLLQNKGDYLVCNIHVNKKSLLGFYYEIRNFVYRKKIANTMSEEEFINLLNQHGYIVEDIYYYSCFPRIGNYFPRFQEFILLKSEKFCFLPKKMSQSFIVVAKKAH